MKALVDAGVDIVEIGVPYSDPVMDGPVIQDAAVRALAGGVRLERHLHRGPRGRRRRRRCARHDLLEPGPALRRRAVRRRPRGRRRRRAHHPRPHPRRGRRLDRRGRRPRPRPGLPRRARARRPSASPTSPSAVPRLRLRHRRHGRHRRARERRRRRRRPRRPAPASTPTCRSASGSASRPATRPAEVGRYADGVIVGSALVRCLTEAATPQARASRPSAPWLASSPTACGGAAHEPARRRTRRAGLPRCRPRSRRRRVGVWHLGPLPIRGYALCILAGIVVAVWLTQRRLERPRATAGRRHRHLRLGRALRHRRRPALPPHHRRRSRYFGEGGDPWKAFAIYEGGLGIWGAVALGALGAWIGCRKNGVDLPRLRRRGGAGRRDRPGDGPLRQLVQQRDLRRADRPAVAAAHLRVGHRRRPRGRRRRRATPSSRATSTRRSSTRRSGACCSRPSSSGSAGASRSSRARSSRPTSWATRSGASSSRTCAPTRPTYILGQRVNTWVSILVFLLGVFLWRRFGRMVRPAAPERPTTAVGPTQVDADPSADAATTARTPTRAGAEADRPGA